MFNDPRKTQKHLKVALFGDGGTGKTRFALSFPKAAVIDTEKGTDPYVGKYDFKLVQANRWRQLQPAIDWLRKNPGQFETLVIDSATIFYQDLIQEIVEFVRNKRGNEIMTHADWGVQKRRWAAFLNLLIDLPMHIVLCFRERPEYEEFTKPSGEESLRKTGNFFLDADKQTKYLFDLSLRCAVEQNRKAKTVRYVVQVEKTRYDWMQMYSTHDITGRRAFDVLFAAQVKKMMDAPAAPVDAGESLERAILDAQAESVMPEIADAEPPPAPKSTGQRVGEMLGHFGAVPANGEKATGEDIKVLMTRAGKLTWPDGRKFTSQDGKALVHGAFEVESSLDLSKAQVNFLYNEFGHVLAGNAELVLDEGGVPFVRRRGSAFPVSTPADKDIPF